MGSIIKPLPEAVWSSVRSGIVLYDLTKVVEELVYNSLDAGATKVHVAVSAGTFLVKVFDNGYGINRDGLVLLGERYATSRFQQLTDFETCGSFGFRGEALCSIADVSLLEVITKTQGMPHGYRKILKGRKCLYIGIEDDKRDVGTTVVVRDLFYNQPVRRRQIQSSPKKLLHSVKKCILRIALVHSCVSFRVADIESDDVLLTTSPCPSPLQLLSSNFGIEASNSMNELKAFEGGMKLFGYISGPSGVLSLKALQYIYINSRFVCKGPIHKMLNQLAAGYEEGKFDKLSRNEKRSRLQTFPTFVLNLSCPRSLYDISFEPSKNVVEFRDWDPILTFVKNAVMRIWSESVSDGKTYSPDLQMNYEVGRKKQRTQKQQASVDDCDIPSYQRKRRSSCRKPNGDAPELVNNQTESLYCNTGSAVASGSVSSFCSGPAKDSKNHPHMESYDEIMCADNSNKQVDYNIGSRWQIESLEDDGSMRKMSMSTALSNDCYNITNNTDVNQDFEKQYQFSPLRRGNLLHYGASLSSELGDQFACDNFTIRQKWMVNDDDDDDDIATEKGKGFDYLLRQHVVKPRWSFSKCAKFQKIRSISSLSSQEKKPSLLFDEFSTEDFPSFLKDVESCSSYLQPSATGWISLESGPSFSPRTLNVDNFVGEYDHGKRGNRYTHFSDDEDCNFTEERVVDGWPRENCLGSSFSDLSWDQELGTSSWSENGQINRHKSNISFLPSCSKTIAGKQEYGRLDLPFEERLVESSDLLNDPLLSAQSNREKCGAIRTRNEEAASPFKMGSGRSHSAPPFRRHRKKYSSLIDLLERGTAVHSNVSLTETSNLDPEHCTKSIKPDHAVFNPSCFSVLPSYGDDSLLAAELSTKRTPESLDIQNADRRRQREFVNDSVKDFALRDVEDIFEPGLKWRSHCPETEYGGSIDNIEDHHPILNISSGILHLAGDSLVPSYIDKNSLKDARVLQQVDKKFIPIIAGRTLSLIDQHAADERIRLEELQQKVLSGEMKQSTYLEDEQELVLPEFGYQLLHNYSEQIQHWGWICNFSTECSSRPFTKSLNALHRQPTVAKLVGVPCILGVNLTDVDLLEFLQQLADTDGSSTVPPSVHRVLNNKACRGAIMFGDTLLPSECSLIVEELKQTSLCFQCAHGRPTTVPIVNLEALHKQISKLGLSRSSQQESWHGLQRYKVSLSRAAHRLSSALD